MSQTGNIEFSRSGLNTSGLLCPRCGGEHLHHRGATFFERREDAPQEVVIKVSGKTVATSVEQSNATNNPSSRRDGMLIHFDCETCPDKSARLDLAIAQHKGSTEISWRFD